MKLKVAALIKRSHDVLTIRLERPPQFQFKAGQFVMVSCPADTRPRAYSIASPPTDAQFIDLTVKHVPGGRVSGWMHGRKPGDLVDIAGPFGMFVLDEHHPKDIVLIAGGAGITPMHCMAKYIIDTKSSANVWLIFGAKTPKDLIYHEELQSMHSEHSNVRIFFTVEDDPEHAWKWHKGFISMDFIRECIPPFQSATYYLCGPPAMVQNIVEGLKSAGIDPSRIRMENW